MTKIVWEILVNSVPIEDKVLSFNYTQGREKYLDNYAGGLLTFTINNANDLASTFSYGDQVLLNSDVNDPVIYAGILQYFWIQEIVYNDHAGNTGLNTATITAADWLSRAGRVLANSYFIPESGTGLQARRFEQSEGGPLPSVMQVNDPGNSSSRAPAVTYTGTVANYINLLQQTERGYLTLEGATLNYISRSVIATYTPPNVTIGRTISATQIAYQQFERIQNGLQFINTATISPDGLASQTAVNSSSVTTYGPAFYSASTVDISTTQASGNASWIANNFSDPTSLRFVCSFTDVAQNNLALEEFLFNTFAQANRTVNLSYQPPGGSLTTIGVVIEGITINVTPEQSQITLTLSPLQYYQYFTLNSSSFGILDTSRLGW